MKAVFSINAFFIFPDDATPPPLKNTPFVLSLKTIH